MKLNRKVFYNKRNGQATVIIPSKTIKKLHKKFKVVSLNNISFSILNAKGEKVKLKWV